MPYYPETKIREDNDVRHNYQIKHYYEHLVRDFTGLNFNEIDELEYPKYLEYLRDAYIYTLSQSERGTDYLNNAWILSRTDADLDKLDKFGE